jgi:hypothetical protein
MNKKYFTEEEKKVGRQSKQKEYYENNRPNILRQQKNWKACHKKERKIYQRNWKLSHKKETTEYEHNKLKIDINYKLSRSLRKRLHNAIKNDHKVGSAVRDLGCTIPELKLRLESMFKPGMTWDNWSYRGWHIDHIKPLSSFDLTNRAEFLKAVHYTNLQPLWGKENLIKNNKEY